MLANWTKETVAAGGTGNLTLGGAVAGHVSIATAMGLDKAVWYAIEDGTSRELGIGHLSASSTLVRDSVRETLVGGVLERAAPSPINVTTAATVSLAAAAQGMIGAHPGYFFGQAGGITGMCSLGQTDEMAGNFTFGAATYLFAVPFLWGASKRVTHASVWVKTAYGGSTVKMGLYEIAPGGGPGRKLTEWDVDTGTTGAKEVALPAPLWLPSGWYYVLAQCSTNGIVFAGPQYSPAGLGLGVHSSGTRSVAIWRTRAYGALPADESAETTYSGNTGATFSVWLR